MDGIIKLFLIVGGIFVLGAHPEAIGNIIGGLLHEAFAIAACLASELYEAAGGGLVLIAAAFGIMVMFKDATSKMPGGNGGKGGGKSGSKKK